MYPKLYQKWFQLSLNPTEMVLVEILMKIVGLLSKATLGHVADNLPLPILAASRLKTLQRFLDSPRFCKEKIWWGIWMEIMAGYWSQKEPIVLAIDRTSWRKYNLLVVSWIIQGRAIPVNWQLLDKLGSSNLDDQQSVIHPITCLLPGYSFVLLGDREFCSKHLATWLLEMFQLEEMFRDYKSYGFNLELTQLNGSRFDAWFLLLTLVYSILAFIGLSTTEPHQKYLARTTESKRQYPRRSIVTLGKTALFAGFDWAFISRLVSRYIKINCHKINYYLRGMNYCNQHLIRV